jgi:hypothetical protein
MGSPFTTPAPIVPATDGQLGYVTALLNDRDVSSMASTQAAYVARATALRLSITWAYAPMADDTPPAVSRVINGTVGRSSTYGERVNAILAHLDASSEVAGGSAYAPLTKAGASKLIDWLTTLPQINRVDMVKAATATDRGDAYPTAEVVPAGRYAVATDDGATNELAFYKVDRPTAGRWAGFVFVKHIVSDEELAVRGPAKATILSKIAADAPGAAARYGHEIGACGLCGRTLTNDESRARGIGPICAAKAGW